MPLPRLHISDTVLIVVDVQERLLPLIAEHDRVVEQCVKLIAGCGVLDVPIVVTEQNARKLGTTVGAIIEALPGGAEPAVTKMKFSACVEEVRKRLSQTGRKRVLVCGIESHVCVLQTALDLVESGYVTFVVCDAIGSRNRADHELAIQRMIGAGVTPMSVEMALLEMVHESGTDRFRGILPLLKD